MLFRSDVIGIINHGRTVKEIAIKEITEMNTSYIWLVAGDTKKAAYILSEKLGINNFKIMEGNNIHIYDSKIHVKDISRELTLNGVDINSIGQKTESLEDYFLKITGEGKNNV